MKEGGIFAEKVVEFLAVRKDGFYIDATAGLGWLSNAICDRLGEKGKILLIDVDKESIGKLKKKMTSKRILVNDSYVNIPRILADKNLPPADGVLFDLGVGYAHLSSNRGFSFSRDGFLDMRYSEEYPLTASDVVNSFPLEKIADIIYRFGEERKSKKIAVAIVKRRRKKKIETAPELARIILSVIPRRGKHPATKTFQALRIFVNNEMENVERIFGFLPEILKKKGRAVFLTYHSIEDRIVKNGLKKLAASGKMRIITKKAYSAPWIERKNQPRSRSAKLRCAEKL